MLFSYRGALRAGLVYLLVSIRVAPVQSIMY